MNVPTNPIYGAHNALTASNPATWLGWLAVPFSRCQHKVYESIMAAELYLKGVRCFDIRVSIDKHRNAVARHGSTIYKANVRKYLNFLDGLSTKEDPIYIRLILEKRKRSTDDVDFSIFCHTCKKTMKNLIFFGGVYKKGWEEIYDFQSPVSEEDVIQYVGSMADDARWYEKLCPWLYAKRKNREHLQDAIEAGKIYLYDFL